MPQSGHWNDRGSDLILLPVAHLSVLQDLLQNTTGYGAEVTMAEADGFCNSGPCYPNPCMNDGKCSTNENATGGYECACPNTFEGNNCEIDIDECTEEGTYSVIVIHMYKNGYLQILALAEPVPTQLEASCAHVLLIGQATGVNIKLDAQTMTYVLMTQRVLKPLSTLTDMCVTLLLMT